MNFETIGSLALSMFLGALIGVERELADKPAGLRTHMLVAGAAALLVLLGDILVGRFGNELDSGVIRTDPLRIIEAIVTGVAVLGAGTIMRQGRHATVQGLTTAATLLFTAATGVCVAVREPGLAISASLLALATLRIVHVVEVRLKRNLNRNKEKTQ